MKLGVLSFGISITHGSIVPIPSLEEPQSITDFNAFILDPLVLGGAQISSPNFFRRQNELQQLVHLKMELLSALYGPIFG